MHNTKPELKIQPQNIRKILVINLGGIGDVLLSTPAVKALKSHFTNALLYFLVVGRVQESVKALPYIDNVFIFELSNPLLYGLRNFKNLLSLRKEKIDLAINMRTLISKSSAGKIKCLLSVINPKIKAGRDTAGRGKFFDITIPEEEVGDSYEMDYDIEMVQVLGAQVVDKTIDFKIDAESKEKVKELLGSNGISESEILIGIHPGGKPSHRWPEQNFSEVMRQLYRQLNCTFVITGSTDEHALADRIIRASNVRSINVAGRINLTELGALLKRCNLYISNDTGSIHLSAIVHTPLVVLFGPGYVSRYNPQKISDRVIVLYKKSDCAPCDRLSCPSMKCLKEISVNEVVQAALRLLEESKTKG